MTGVETHAEPARAPGAVQQRAQLAQRPAEPAAGAGGVLQRDAHPIAARAAQRFPHRVRHAPQPPFDAGAQMRSRVNHHAAEPQRLAALELVGERIDRLAPGRRRRARQVDEIARVGEHGRDAAGPARGPKRARLVVAERPRRPLPLVLEEDLNGMTAERLTPLERQRQPPGDRHVRAELVGRPGHLRWW